MKNLSILIKSKNSDDNIVCYAINNKSTRRSRTLLVGNLETYQYKKHRF